METVSFQPFFSLKEPEIPVRARHKFSETGFKFIQLNGSECSGYVQQDGFAPL